MNFNLDSEQQLLQDSVRRFVERAYGFDARAALVAAGQGGSAANWSTFAENGWLAAALPEAHGGLGGSVTDTALIAQQLGRGLVIEPYLGCAVLAPQTMAAAGTGTQQARVLPSVADGSKRLALACSELPARGDPAVVHTVATPCSGGYVLNGRKTLVLGAQDADWFIVSAKIAPGAEGISLFLVDSHATGLGMQALRLHDGSQAADVLLQDVRVAQDDLLGAPGAGLPALRHGLAHGIAALCAELVGGMERAIELTAEYLKTRHQFGVAIGSFQALQHRMADMAAELELARSMLYALLAALQNEGPALQEHRASQAKALVGRAARYVCGQAIQLHGGIGMTEEYAVGHYFKRAVVAEILFGTADFHDARCASRLQEASLQEARTA
ncbi:Acryloyl-CoA reductase (NADH) [Cupriavidus yeoncheonensis]|uniref:Acryloyl-CoA reductase (NADH) n=1 Tax=Cupriavidus yeoncheonensis TaxID=1462994 RepID=A0A916IVL4_9BURK|nr:acyl-CoA dehydrogenase family protein [Cupriavidus yeoncheonensis]CAG2146680.1 Acryloyl-CoA reductase (NADH) [Cupriavidus yeoncheonensis]